MYIIKYRHDCEGHAQCSTAASAAAESLARGARESVTMRAGQGVTVAGTTSNTQVRVECECAPRHAEQVEPHACNLRSIPGVPTCLYTDYIHVLLEQPTLMA